MRSASKRIALNVPITFTSSTFWNGSSACGPSLVTVRCAQPIPAQFTAMRSAPNSATARSTAAWTWSALVTSQAQKIEPRPSSLANSSPLERGRSRIAMRAPAETSSRAVAPPRPEAPPVTSAPAPWICIDLGFLFEVGVAAHALLEPAPQQRRLLDREPTLAHRGLGGEPHRLRQLPSVVAQVLDHLLHRIALDHLL